MSVLRAISYRPFVLVWIGQTISRFGDGIHFVVLSWWVIETTGSATASGIVAICLTVPQLLFLLIGGVAVDRVSRLGVMLAADVVSAIAVGMLAIMSWLGVLALWHIYLVSISLGLVSAFFSPAYMAVIPELVPTEALPSANSLRSVSSRGAAILGPAVGGLLVAVGGVSLAFTLDAISFVIAAACVVGLAGVPALRQAGQRSTSALEEIRDGFRTVASTPWLWITIVIAAVSNLALAGPLAAALPLLVKVNLGSDSRGYALLQSLFATGAFCGAMWMGRATRLRRRGITIYAAWFVAAVALTILGLSGSLVIAGLAILIIGLSETMFGLVWTNALQTSVPSDRLGRVASLDALGSFALLPVAYALAGFAADRVGPGPVFVIGGIVGGLIIALGFLHPGVRALD